MTELEMEEQGLELRITSRRDIRTNYIGIIYICNFKRAKKINLITRRAYLSYDRSHDQLITNEAFVTSENEAFVERFHHRH